MTIKVFTTPRRTRHFEIWRLESPMYTASQRLYPNPVDHPLLSFPIPVLSILRFLFHIPFPMSLLNVHMYASGVECRSVESDIPPLRGFSILFTILALRAAPAITRFGSTNAVRARRQIGGNRGRRNLSRPVTTLSDVVARGSDVRMCPLEDEGKYDRATITFHKKL